jgi:hypothetical protein
MRQTFIISLIILPVIILRAQGVIADSLLHYEYNYFKSSNDTIKQTLLIKKTAYYLSHHITGPETFNEIKRVNINAVNDKRVKHNFLWNAAAVSYLNNETDRARYYLSEYSFSSKDSSVEFNLLSVLINKYSDTAEVRRRLNCLSSVDTLFKGLNCFYEIINYHRKHRNFYLLSSAIIPGSGTIMNGEVAKGVISLALAAGSVYGIIKLVEYGLYLNAALWGTGVGLKFYTGNIKLTEKSFYKAEEQKKNKLTTNCELTLKKILDKYPLTLKEL